MNKALCHWAAGLGIAAIAGSSARSVEAAPFASDGTFAVGVERVFGVDYTSETTKVSGSNVENNSSSTSIAFLGSMPTTVGAIPRLNFDVFLGPGVSLGGGLMYQRLSADPDTDTDTNGSRSVSYFLFAPRAGFGFALSDTVALWPRLGFSYLYTKSTYDAGSSGMVTSGDTSTSMWYMSLDALLLLSPIEHVSFTLGPAFDVLVGGPNRSGNEASSVKLDESSYSIGLHAGMTVWFN